SAVLERRGSRGQRLLYHRRPRRATGAGGSAGIRRAFPSLRTNKSDLDSPHGASYRGGDIGPRGRCDGGWKMATTRVANAQPAGARLTAAQMERYLHQISLVDKGVVGQVRHIRSNIHYVMSMRKQI